MSKISVSWSNIENWCAQNFPELVATFNPPISTQDLLLLKNTITVPAMLEESLLIHDGQNGHPALLWFGDVYKLMTAKEIISAYKSKSTTVNEPFIPFAIAANSDLLLLDQSNATVWIYSHDSVECKMMFESLEQCFEQLAEDFQHNRYEQGEYGSLTRVFPTPSEIKMLLLKLAPTIKAQKGTVDDLVKLIAKETNQPNSVVTSHISEFTMEEALV